MTFKQLLGYDINDLEKMSDEELTKLLAPFMLVVQPDTTPKVRKGTVIDVSGNVERAAKKGESIDAYIARMQQAMLAKMS